MTTWRRVLQLGVSMAGLVAAGSWTVVSAEPGDISLSDPTGDGRPDIVALRVGRSPGSAAVVKIRVQDVQAGTSNEVRLYVDPTGQRRRPAYVFTFGIDRDGGWLMRRTDGWRLDGGLGTCGERIRLRRPAPSSRVVVVRMPFACFGDSGARFAARTDAFTDGPVPVGAADWSPARRTLTPTFQLP